VQKMAKKRDLCKGSKPKNDAVHFLSNRSKKKLGCCKSVTNKSSDIIPLEKVMSDEALPESIAKGLKSEQPKSIVWKEKYVFSEKFPYFYTPENVEYECFREKFLMRNSDNGSDKWLNSDEIMILLAAELEFMKTQNKKAYVFSLSAWQTIRGVDEQLAGADLRITHIRRPFSRFRENVKKLIWQANRGKNIDSTRREVQQGKLDLFQYDVLFMPINQDMHWSLIVINKQKDIIETLVAGDFMKEEQDHERYS